MSCAGPLEQTEHRPWHNHSDGSPQLVEYAVCHVRTYRSGHGYGTTNHFAKLQCLEHTPSSTPDPRAGAGGSQHPQGSSSFSLDGQDTGRRSLYGVGVEFWLHLTSECMESSQAIRSPLPSLDHFIFFTLWTQTWGR